MINFPSKHFLPNKYPQKIFNEPTAKLLSLGPRQFDTDYAGMDGGFIDGF